MQMLRNIPPSLTRSDLVSCLNRSFKGDYNFLFLPGLDSGEGNRGFAFVHFRNAEKAQDFVEAFNAKSPKDCLGIGDDDAKACEVVGARIPNVDKNLQRLRQSVAKNKDGKDESAWYPTFISDSGEIETFPMPERGS